VPDSARRRIGQVVGLWAAASIAIAAADGMQTADAMAMMWCTWHVLRFSEHLYDVNVAIIAKQVGDHNMK